MNKKQTKNIQHREEGKQQQHTSNDEEDVQQSDTLKN